MRVKTENKKRVFRVSFEFLGFSFGILGFSFGILGFSLEGVRPKKKKLRVMSSEILENLGEEKNPENSLALQEQNRSYT